MDGGKNSGAYSAADAIVNTVNLINIYLKHKYRVGPDYRLKFNSWVVTHWDKDHFHGVRDLLEYQDLYWQMNNFVGKPKLYCGKWVRKYVAVFVSDKLE